MLKLHVVNCGGECKFKDRNREKISLSRDKAVWKYTDEINSDKTES